jgi:hemolysin III
MFRALCANPANRIINKEQIMSGITLPNYKLSEEIAHSITHGIGIVLAIAALAILTAFAAVFGSARHIVGCSIFGATMILLYTASTLYHAVQNKKAKKVFRVFDHSAIFLLIAGTYTPFTLVTLKGGQGWALFGIIWGLAFIGVLLQTISKMKFEILSLILYLAMGWIGVVAFKPMFTLLPTSGLIFLIAGGLSYTFGVIFYAWERLPFNHAIWHVFVLGGSVSHFFAVLFSVIPRLA